MTALAPSPTKNPSRRRVSPLALFEALATPHGVDRYLELINPMATVRELRGEVTEVRRQTPDTVTLTLRPNRRWKGFRAGQFVQLHIYVDGVRRTRCYSPAGSQHRSDGRFELTIKAQSGGIVSQYLLAEAAPGMVVGLSPADGTFCLPDQRPERVLLVSGGSGITPVLSMLRTLCDEGHTGEVVFVHYANTAADVAYRPELAQLAAEHPNVRVVFGYTEHTPGSDEDSSGGELRGLFDESHLRHAAPWFADADTYLCGPAALMHAVREQYRGAGIEARLHTEEFASALAAPAVAGGTVSFERSGVTAENSGISLLEQAEAAGLNPEYGCRMGICFSCTKVKTSGCTRDLRTGAVHSDPDTEIQLCISAPVGDVVVDL
jgi:ferredoxin-NADP reductase